MDMFEAEKYRKVDGSTFNQTDSSVSPMTSAKERQFPSIDLEGLLDTHSHAPYYTLHQVKFALPHTKVFTTLHSTTNTTQHPVVQHHKLYLGK